MRGQVPTLVAYGSPEDPGVLQQMADAGGWGVVQDNGRARDAVFTVYENFARADALIAFPNAHPLHLVTLLAEAEVGHPTIVQERAPGTHEFKAKPIIFFGSAEQWQAFKNCFGMMKEQGLMRDGFDRLAHYEASPAAARGWIEQHLPQELPTTRVQYYLHSQKRPDLVCETRDDVRPPSPITVSCFGSASTTNPNHLACADEAARMFARNNWNILHGGGDRGVMRQLTDSGADCKAYVVGVTVHSSGAPKIAFEKKDMSDHRPENIDDHIASKDMLHRIESYAGNAYAFVSLDGGIGSVQEVLVIAELLARRHPAVIYETLSGEIAAKPMWLMNQNGIYTPLLNYLAQQGFGYLLDEIKVADSIEQLEAGLREHLLQHPPRPLSLEQRHEFREGYGSIDLPKAPALPNGLEELAAGAEEAIRLPDLTGLAADADGRGQAHAGLQP